MVLAPCAACADDDPLASSLAPRQFPSDTCFEVPTALSFAVELEVPMVRYLATVEYISVLWVLLAVFVALFLRTAANPKLFSWHVYLTCFLAYYCSFGIIILCPLDLAMTMAARREEDSDGVRSRRTLINAYAACYWPCFVLGSFVMGWQEMYMQSGQFTPLSRARDATKRLAKDWCLMAVGGGAFAGLLYATGAASDSGALRMTCVALTNTLGLCAIVALLGYGLVEMPREMFKNGNLHTRNERTRMRSADAFKVRSARRRGCLHGREGSSIPRVARRSSPKRRSSSDKLSQTCSRPKTKFRTLRTRSCTTPWRWSCSTHAS